MTSAPPPTPIPSYAPGTELYGMLSVTGEVVIEPKYEYLDLFSEEGFACFCDHGRWGFVNTAGEEVIPAQFEDANNFSEGLAAVKIDDLWGFIDETGELVIEPRFEGVEEGFKYGRCIFFEDDKCGFIDDSGAVIEEPQHAEIQQTTYEYYIITSSNEKYGVIDRDGNTVLELQDSYIEYVASEGYIFFPAFWKTVKNRDKQEAVPFEEAVDENGQVTYELQKDRSVNYYEVPYWTTEKDSYWWSGHNPCHFLEAYDSDEGYSGIYNMRKGEYVTEKIYNGVDRFLYYNEAYYAITQISRMNGLISLSTGKTILGNDYYYLVASPHNQFAAHVRNKYTLVFDGEGKILYKTEDNCLIWNFLPGFDCWEYECEKSDGTFDHWGLINTEGETVFRSDIEFGWFIDGTPYLENDEGSISFIAPDYQLQERGPYVSFEDQTRKSGIIIAHNASGKTEIINVRGEILFSFITKTMFVNGNKEYFVFAQELQ